MSSRADQIALKASLKLTAFIAFLLFLRYAFSEGPENGQNRPAPAQTFALARTEPPRNLPAPEPPKVLSTPSPPPIPRPRNFSIRIVPTQWSKQIEVPPGCTAYVTFTLGRIRVKRNGMDAGVLFRQPLIQSEQTGGNSFNIGLNPFAVLNRTPRTVSFDSDTRTLRFMSGESTPGEVVVDLRW